MYNGNNIIIITVIMENSKKGSMISPYLPTYDT